MIELTIKVDDLEKKVLVDMCRVECVRPAKRFYDKIWGLKTHIRMRSGFDLFVMEPYEEVKSLVIKGD